MRIQELIKNYDEAVKRVHTLTGDESEEVMNDLDIKKMTDEEKINLLSKVQGELDRAYFELKAKLPELDPVLQIVEIIAYQAKCVLIVEELQKLGVNYELKPMN